MILVLKKHKIKMTTTIKIADNEFVVLKNGSRRCQCGTVLVKKDGDQNIINHLATPSHKRNLTERQRTGNVVIFQSMLVPNLKVYRV